MMLKGSYHTLFYYVSKDFYPYNCHNLVFHGYLVIYDMASCYFTLIVSSSVVWNNFIDPALCSLPHCDWTGQVSGHSINQ